MVEIPTEDELPKGARRDLALALHRLRADAGRPSLRDLSKFVRERDDLGDAVSHETIGALLRSGKPPRWIKLECLVTVLVEKSIRRPDLDKTLLYFHGLWDRAMSGGNSTAPEVPSETELPEAPFPPTPDLQREALRAAAGIFSGTADPTGGNDGDIYFKIIEDNAAPNDPLAVLIRAHTHRSGLPIALPALHGPSESTVMNCAVAFSPSGALLATTDKEIRLWDPATGRLLRSLRGHTDIAWGAAFSPDGRWLATAGHDGTVRMWDPETGRAHAYYVDHDGPVWGVAFSPDGRLLASAGHDGTVTVRDPETQKPFANIRHTSSVYRAVFSPDGRLLAAACDEGIVRLWVSATGEPASPPLRGHRDRVNDVAFSPDGRMLATASADGTARVWPMDSTTDLTERTLAGHRGTVEGVAFSPKGRLLATTGHDGTVRLWNPATGRPLGSPLHGHADCVFRAAFSPDGSFLATASRDATTRLWVFP
ncbi:WD40 repeat domain-containing protein [Streptomyces sp. NPDC058155]|uniref:WD40 repeat domain-containing protein n=1 Tax=Streptomyces sp. NPDC058155 TaxID=3346359 RepID=UPI0036E6F02F